ncbi:siderophore-iron reductase FhuF [Pseudomonas sp. HR96]|uniref:siderophore-iron reductase FhuF n=1 Tax=Pseudomonas sp. HR96 TaxID=1027966 RepID=UPI002A7557EB|nr:siderophore-iron reductase FhuF [Pseudomonas sp. HR96]WPP02044.1 siderophore-iron reductase FhuF [Pseudomonas sp. HR96]
MSGGASTAAVLAELDRRFAAAQLAPLQSLALDQGQAAIRGQQLWAPATLDTIVAGHAREYPGADRRALLSHWSKSYLEALLPGALLACLLLDRQLPLALDNVALRLDEDGSVSTLLLGAASQRLPAGSDLYGRCQALLHGNLQPFVEQLARHARLSARALWGNVAAYLAWAMRLLAERLGLPLASLQQALQLFSQPAYPDGWLNPVQRAYQFPQQLDGQGWRRVCCLRYCLEPLPHCVDCPLLKAPRRR